MKGKDNLDKREEDETGEKRREMKAEGKGQRGKVRN